MARRVRIGLGNGGLGGSDPGPHGSSLGGFASIGGWSLNGIARARRPSALLLAGIFGVLACEGTPPEKGATADIRWLLFQDVTSIGGSAAEGPEALGSIRAAALLPTQERFVVADGQTQHLHIFDFTGRHVRRIGGRGGGPGEHRAIGAIWGADDGGFCTWDAQAGRITRFGPEGSVVATGLAELDGLESIIPSFEGFFSDCRFVLRDQPFTLEMRDVPEGMRQDTVRFVLFGPDGRQLRTLARVPGAEYWFKNRNRSVGRVQLIFGEALFGFPHGDEFWFGVSDRPLWTRLDLQAGVLGHREFERPHRTVSEVQVREERERRIGEVRVPRVDLPPGVLDEMEESQREGLRAAPARYSAPAYDIILPGADGGFWFREHPLPADTVSVWTFVDSLGEEAGSTSLPRKSTILGGTEDLVLVGTEDELGAPVLRLLKRAS